MSLHYKQNKQKAQPLASGEAIYYFIEEGARPCLTQIKTNSMYKTCLEKTHFELHGKMTTKYRF